ncbi:hypothetical protein ACCI51_13610 [Microbulbifer echini]|uniref:Uncharacterized protein n=1 Tax=Microbulbifer echini TaxID=1529067 RepID=A0ABV4NQU0_9GAMM
MESLHEPSAADSTARGTAIKIRIKAGVNGADPKRNDSNANISAVVPGIKRRFFCMEIFNFYQEERFADCFFLGMKGFSIEWELF